MRASNPSAILRSFRFTSSASMNVSHLSLGSTTLILSTVPFAPFSGCSVHAPSNGHAKVSIFRIRILLFVLVRRRSSPKLSFRSSNVAIAKSFRASNLSAKRLFSRIASAVVPIRPMKSRMKDKSRPIVSFLSTSASAKPAMFRCISIISAELNVCGVASRGGNFFFSTASTAIWRSVAVGTDAKSTGLHLGLKEQMIFAYTSRARMSESPCRWSGRDGSTERTRSFA